LRKFWVLTRFRHTSGKKTFFSYICENSCSLESTRKQLRCSVTEMISWLTKPTMWSSAFFTSRQLYSYSIKLRDFTQSEGSLPSSQEPSIGPYPEPDISSPYQPNLSPILSTHYVLIFLVGSFLLAFPPKSYIHSSSPPFVLHAARTLSSFTCSI
jgi:hypothetical protein